MYWIKKDRERYYYCKEVQDEKMDTIIRRKIMNKINRIKINNIFSILRKSIKSRLEMILSL